MKLSKTAAEFVVVVLILIVGGLIISVPVSNRWENNTGNEEPAYEHGDLDRPQNSKEESADEGRKYNAERYEYIFKMLRDPKTGRIPNNVRVRELAYAHLIDQENLHLDSYSTAAATGFSYSQAGPYNIGGRTRALGITTDNSGNPGIYIAGGVSGGIWKSTDYGSTWQLKTSLDQSMSVTSLAEDPVNKNVWYYCGGEYIGNSASDGGVAPYRGGGVYKSTDNGDSWSVLASTKVTDQASFNSVYQYCSKIVVSPTTESVFVCSNAGVIMRSTDGGNTFSPVVPLDQNCNPTTLTGCGLNDHYFTSIAVASNGTLIAALSKYGYQSSTQSPPGIYLSTDDGNTWSDITPVDMKTYDYERTVLAFAPSDPTVAYSFTYSGTKVNGHDKMLFFKYTISGTSATSEDRSVNLPAFGGQVGDFDQGDYNMLVAVKPDDSNFVLIGSTNLYRSFDGFSTDANNVSKNWIGGYSNENNVSSYPGNHPDQHIIAFVPGYPDQVVDGHDGGLSFTSDITYQGIGNAVKWSSLDNGYLTTQFYDVTMNNSKGDLRILGGAQDNGSPFFRASSGTNSISTDETSGDGGVAYLGNSYAYGSTQNGSVVRFAYTASGDITQTGRVDVDPVNAKNQLFITPYAIDPDSEDVMYYAAGNSLWRNVKMESSSPRSYWGSGPVLSTPDTTLNITAMTVSDQPSHVLYMGVSGGNQDTAHVYVMNNATTGKSVRDISSPDFPVGGYISDIAVNPQNANEFIVVFSNYNVSSLFYTDDGGKTYSQIQGNLQGTMNTGYNEYIGPSIRSAAIVNTGDGKYFLAGTSVGLYLTNSLSGTSTLWLKQASNIIGDALVTSLYSRPADGWIAIGTHGRGIFLGKPNVALPIEKSPVADLPTGFSLSQNYPNPFNPSTNITFKLNQDARVTLRVYDLTGRLVSTLVDNAYRGAGQYNVRFDANQLASGIYFYRLTAITKSNQLTQTRKMTLVK